MWCTRSCIGSKSRTTRRTSCRIARIRPSRSSRSCALRRRSSSKCISDSRWAASRPAITRSRCPSSARAVPIIGCTSSRTPRLRLASSSVTESTRNGESSVFVSMTVPGTSVAVGLDRRHEDAHARGVVAPCVDERERRAHGAQELLDPAQGQIVIGQPAEHHAGEREERVAAIRRRGRLDPLGELGEHGMEPSEPGAARRGQTRSGASMWSGSAVPSGVEPVRLIIVAGRDGPRVASRGLCPDRLHDVGRPVVAPELGHHVDAGHALAPQRRRRAPSPSPSPAAHARSGSSPAARIRSRAASGISIPGTSLCRKSAWRADTNGNTPAMIGTASGRPVWRSNAARSARNGSTA